MGKLLIVLLLTLGIGFVFFYTRIGYYKEAHFHGIRKHSFHFIYKKHQGAYHKIASVISSVEKWAKENHIPCKRTFGIYWDHPESTKPESLRSWGGCLTKPSFKKRLPDKIFSGYLNKMDYLIASFEGSPSLTPMKTYPIFFNWLKKNERAWKHEGFIIDEYQMTKNGWITHSYFPLKKITY